MFLSKLIRSPASTTSPWKIRLVEIQKDQQQQGTKTRLCQPLISSKEPTPTATMASGQQQRSEGRSFGTDCGGNASEAVTSEQGMQETSPIRTRRWHRRRGGGSFHWGRAKILAGETTATRSGGRSCGDPAMSATLLTARQRAKSKTKADGRPLLRRAPARAPFSIAAFAQRLTAAVPQRLPAGCGAAWDSDDQVWVSPPTRCPGHYRRVIGHGLNAAELSANPRLDRHFCFRTSTNLRPCGWPRQPDAVLVCGRARQYLQHPEADRRELARVVRPGGEVIRGVQQRMFARKSPVAWLNRGDRERLTLVGQLLVRPVGKHRARSSRRTPRAQWPARLVGGQGDPFFAVVRPSLMASRRIFRRIEFRRLLPSVRQFFGHADRWPFRSAI